MLNLLKALACTVIVATAPQHALAEEEEKELTCVYVEDKNTIYCDFGSFSDLTADCLTSSDNDACCIVTEGESETCADTSPQPISVTALLRRVLIDGHAVTFSAPSEEAKSKFNKKD